MITFGKFAKEYNVPRASVYSIMSDLEKNDINRYNQLVDASSGTKKLNEEGIAYILEIRGIDIKETSQDNVQTTSKQKQDNDVLIAIELLRSELETRNRQFDTLQDNYNDLARNMSRTNDMLAELTKNQQLLTKQLQDKELYIDSLKHSQDNVQTVQDNQETVSDNDIQDKKSFWSRWFG